MLEDCIHQNRNKIYRGKHESGMSEDFCPKKAVDQKEYVFEPLDCTRHVCQKKDHEPHQNILNNTNMGEEFIHFILGHFSE